MKQENEGVVACGLLRRLIQHRAVDVVTAPNELLIDAMQLAISHDERRLLLDMLTPPAVSS